MKKYYLLFSLLFVWVIGVNAQTYLSEGFETAVPPTGWLDEVGSGADSGNNWAQNTSEANSGTSSAFFDDFSGDNDRWLISSVIDLSGATTPELTYFEYVNFPGFAGTHDVLYSTNYSGSGDPTVATWTTLNSAIGAQAWEARGPYALPTSATVYVAFHYVGDFAAEWHIDDVLIQEPPSCPDPSGLTAINATTTGADLGWTENGSSSNWDLEIGTAGFTPTGTPTVNDTGDNPYTWTGGTGATDYEFYVRSDCAMDNSSDVSTWVGPFSFATTVPNDICTNATSLDPIGSGSCSVISASTVAASDSGLQPNCDNIGTNLDLWYSFSAPASGALEFTFNDTGDGSVEYAVWTSCGSATGDEIVCVGGANELANGDQVSGLTPGDSYLLQIWNDDFTPGAFEFCLFEPSCIPSSSTLSLDNSACPTIDVLVDVTDLGSAATLNISNDVNASVQNGVGTGQHVLTGFSPGDGTVTVTIADAADATCFSELTIDIPAACPPANDECAGAIPLTVNPDDACGTVTNGTTLAATASPQADDVTGTPNNDVWFSFVAAETDHIISLLNRNTLGGGTSPSTDMGMGVYDGTGGCAGLVLNNDSDPEEFTITGLSVGTTYYVRVYGWFGSIQNVSFDICVGTPVPPPPPPANDECAGAIPLTVNPDDACGTVTNGTTLAATASPQADDVTGTPNNDVWYSFVATGTDHFVELLNVTNLGGGTSTSTDMGMGVYDGSGGCAGLVFFDDSDPNRLNLTGLTIGTTYYVRVYGWSNTIQNNSFDICVGTPPPPPANDDCSGAIALTVGNGVCSNSEMGTNASATASEDADPSIPAPGCASYQGGDVWFSAVVPASGDLIIETSTTDGFTDGGMAAYSGTCGALTLISCNDDGNDNPGSTIHSRIELTGRTPGETIYVRVWEFGNNAVGNFGICAWDPSGSMSVSSGGSCVVGSANVDVTHANGNTYTWVPVLDGSGDLIAEIYPNGNELGAITGNINSFAPVQAPSGVWVLGREIVLEPQNQPTGTDPIVRLYLTNAELSALSAVDASVTGAADLNLSKRSGIACGTAPDGNEGVITQSTNGTGFGELFVEFTIPDFSQFFLRGGTIVLPIDLISFTGEVDEDVNKLHWVTASETNGDRYEVERTIDPDSSNWETVATENAVGNSTTQLEYSAIDSNPLNAGYYRLAMYDLDGTVEYSSIIFLEREVSSQEVILYPNPAVGGTVNVKNVHLFDSVTEINVYNSTGTMVKTLSIDEVTTHDLSIDVTNLSRGFYILIGSDSKGNTLFTKKFVR